MEPQSISVVSGERVTFSWPGGWHSVYQLTDPADFTSCAKEGGTELWRASSKGNLELTFQTPGTYYYICRVGSHCNMGQKLAITVLARATPSPPLPPIRLPPSPTPPPPARVPSPSLGGAIPAGGVQVMEGGRDGVMTFCLKPGMEHVTSVAQVAGASTRMRHEEIAAQCCTRDQQCRRIFNSECIAGISSNEAPFVTAMTYGETVAKCASLGLELCDQSCRNTGCFYNRHPVFTGKPCPVEPPSSPSLPPPSSRPPADKVVYSSWTTSSAIAPLAQSVGEPLETFRQRCLVKCIHEASGCSGVRETACDRSLCCVFFSGTPQGSSFLVPTNGTFVKAFGSAVSGYSTVSGSTDVKTEVESMQNAPSLRSAAAVRTSTSVSVIVNPWDDSYGGAEGSDNSTYSSRGAPSLVVGLETSSGRSNSLLELIGALLLGIVLGVIGSLLVVHFMKLGVGRADTCQAKPPPDVEIIGTVAGINVMAERRLSNKPAEFC